MVIPDSIKNCADVNKEIPAELSYPGWEEDLKYLEKTCKHAYKGAAIELAKMMSLSQRAHDRQKFVSDTEKLKLMNQRSKSENYADALFPEIGDDPCKVDDEEICPTPRNSRRKTRSKIPLNKSLSVGRLDDLLTSSTSRLPDFEEGNGDDAPHEGNDLPRIRRSNSGRLRRQGSGRRLGTKRQRRQKSDDGEADTGDGKNEKAGSKSTAGDDHLNGKLPAENRRRTRLRRQGSGRTRNRSTKDPTQQDFTRSLNSSSHAKRCNDEELEEIFQELGDVNSNSQEVEERFLFTDSNPKSILDRVYGSCQNDVQSKNNGDEATSQNGDTNNPSESSVDILQGVNECNAAIAEDPENDEGNQRVPSGRTSASCNLPDTNDLGHDHEELHRRNASCELDEKSPTTGRGRRRSMSAGPEFRSRDNPADKICEEEVEGESGCQKTRKQGRQHSRRRSISAGPAYRCKNDSDEMENEKITRRSRRRSMSAGPECRDDLNKNDDNSKGLRRSKNSRGKSGTRRSRRRSRSAGPEYRRKSDRNNRDKEDRINAASEDTEKAAVQECVSNDRIDASTDESDLPAASGLSHECAAATQRNLQYFNEKEEPTRSSATCEPTTAPAHRSENDPEEINMENKESDKENQTDAIQLGCTSSGFNREALTQESLGYDPTPFFEEFGLPDVNELGYELPPVRRTMSCELDERPHTSRYSRRRSASAGPECRYRDNPAANDNKKSKGRRRGSSKRKGRTRSSRRRSQSAGPGYRRGDDTCDVDKEKEVSRRNGRGQFGRKRSSSGRGGRKRSSSGRRRRPHQSSRFKVEKSQSDSSLTCSISESGNSSGNSVGKPKETNIQHAQQRISSDFEKQMEKIAQQSSGKRGSSGENQKTPEKENCDDNLNERGEKTDTTRDLNEQTDRNKSKEIENEIANVISDSCVKGLSSESNLCEKSNDRTDNKKSQTSADTETCKDDNALTCKLHTLDNASNCELNGGELLKKPSKKKISKQSALAGKVDKGEDVEAFFAVMTTRLGKVEEPGTTESSFSGVEKSILPERKVGDLNVDPETCFGVPNSEEEFQSAVSRALALQSLCTSGGGDNFSRNIRHLFQQEVERKKVPTPGSSADLFSHLERNGDFSKKHSKKFNKHGDEISLGTANLSIFSKNPKCEESLLDPQYF